MNQIIKKVVSKFSDLFMEVNIIIGILVNDLYIFLVNSIVGIFS